MNLPGIKGGYAFARNPIILQETWPPEASDRLGGVFSVEINQEEIYSGRFYPPLDIDISEIVDAHVKFFPEPPEDSTDPVITLENSAAFARRECCFKCEYDQLRSYAEFIAIPGGISRQNYKRLLALDQDAFSTRFLNPGSNFFLSTRTADWCLVIKETELFPLCFIVGKETGQWFITDHVSRHRLTLASLPKGVYALDIKALRRKFMENYSVIPSVFDVHLGAHYSCRIVVGKCEPAKERYRLKFRNSLGVFELIELTGELSFAPDYSGSNESTFCRYNPITGSFYTDRERVERRQTVTIETGVKNPDEVRFLMDMLGSEEVYLLDATPEPCKVIPSVENFTYRLRPEAPQKYTLKLVMADSETNILQDIFNGKEGVKPGIFSKHFSKQFN